MGGPLDPPAGSSSAKRAPRRSPPRLPPAKIIALAVLANLLLATSVAAAVAPVETSGHALSLYDAMPEWARGLLGDTSTEDGVERGFLGDWFERFHINALKGDPQAQLEMPLSPTSDLPQNTWVSNESVNVQWVNHGAPLTYHLQASTTEDLAAPIEPEVTTSGTNATLQIPAGHSWVHLQATHNGKSGPVATLGPFQSDPQAPPAPELMNAPRMDVDAYQFTLEWSAVEARSGITGYHVERLSNSEWQLVATVDADDERTHTERNRPNGRYTFRVIAESGSGLQSDPSVPLAVHVDAQGSLVPPGTGQFHRGVNAVYDSVLYMWDISDPSRYNTVDEVHGGRSGLSDEEVELYTSDGWGITLDNQTLRGIVADELGATWQGDELVGGERNNLEIGMILFEWMFDEVDYDFGKFDGTDFDLLRANEVLDAGGGICGDLTALYVTLLRIAGVPARPVHGYLINQGGTPEQEFEGSIGGFHMWPEIYVGGEDRDPTGDGWIPVDVSGVTGDYSDEKMLFYFGVANPNYLQLGIQKDLGDEALDDDHERNKWNVWANMRYSFAQGSDPQVEFDADAKLAEQDKETGRLWFSTDTNERVYCPEIGGETAPCEGEHRRYYDNVKGRSVRTIDYGADVRWSGDVHEVMLTLRYPETHGPNQVAMWTAYEHNRDCIAREVSPDMDRGYLEWTIPGSQEPCSR